MFYLIWDSTLQKIWENFRLIEKIALLSKRDIPYEAAQLIIHQPTIKQISYIGENNFFKGCQYLNFSKNSLQVKDKINLENVSDFEILMTILKNKDSTVQEAKICLQEIFLLILPDYQVIFLPTSILFSRKTQDGFEEHSLTKENFEGFKNIVSEMFCLKYIQGESGQGDYNPGGPQARALVKKFQERQVKLAKLKGKTDKTSIEVLYRYISVLAVGQHKDINQLMNYSLYQLVDQFRRFKMADDYETVFRLKLAGAKDVESVSHWMGDLDDKL